jgi:XTP/dITP diphosphohydrolase
VHYFEGKVFGTIISEMRGTNGFGYDPIFVPNHYSKTFAEMSLEEKSKISHRAIAVQKLTTFLQK